MRPEQLAAERSRKNRGSPEPRTDGVGCARQAEVHLESEGPTLAINTGSRAATGATP